MDNSAKISARNSHKQGTRLLIEDESAPHRAVHGVCKLNFLIDSLFSLTEAVGTASRLKPVSLAD